MTLGMPHVVVHAELEIGLHCVHEDQIVRRPLYKPGRAERADDAVVVLLADEFDELAGELVVGTRPIVLGAALDELVAADDDFLLPFELHEVVPHGLGVHVDVVGEALGDEQPEHVRAEDKGTVLGIGGMHRRHEGMILAGDDMIPVVGTCLDLGSEQHFKRQLAAVLQFGLGGDLDRGYFLNDHGFLLGRERDRTSDHRTLLIFAWPPIEVKIPPLIARRHPPA